MRYKVENTDYLSLMSNHVFYTTKCSFMGKYPERQISVQFDAEFFRIKDNIFELRIESFFSKPEKMGYGSALLLFAEDEIRKICIEKDWYIEKIVGRLVKEDKESWTISVHLYDKLGKRLFHPKSKIKLYANNEEISIKTLIQNYDEARFEIINKNAY